MALLSFRRVEKKYIVTEEQKNALLRVLLAHMDFDPYCQNEKTYTIHNVYYDTSDDLLIRKSLQSPEYKEKIRVRKYTGMNNYFLEVKKKYNGVVGKRRITLSGDELDSFINDNVEPVRNSFAEQQAVKEIGWVLKRYKLIPKVYLSYDRLALFDKTNSELRITFDNNIHTNRDNPSFECVDYEDNLLDKDKYILEIKYVSNYPLWLARALNECLIRPKSFSKYGTEYKNYYVNSKLCGEE